MTRRDPAIVIIGGCLPKWRDRATSGACLPARGDFATPGGSILRVWKKRSIVSISCLFNLSERLLRVIQDHEWEEYAVIEWIWDDRGRKIEPDLEPEWGFLVWLCLSFEIVWNARQNIKLCHYLLRHFNFALDVIGRLSVKNVESRERWDALLDLISSSSLVVTDLLRAKIRNTPFQVGDVGLFLVIAIKRVAFISTAGI